MLQDPLIKHLIDKYDNPVFIDEVGLGSIFGELVACAVLLPKDFYDNRVDDSKKIKHKELYAIAEDLKQTDIIYSFGIVKAKELLNIKNMFKANKLAMVRAVKGLSIKPDAVFVDGKFNLPECKIENYAIIKGDQKVFGIAAASIIAKNFRDHLMIDKYGEDFSIYDIAQNKGYKSPKHFKGIRKHGVTKYHRTWMPMIQRIINK